MSCPGPSPDAGKLEPGIKRLNRQADGTYAVDASWKPQRYSIDGVLQQPWGRNLATDAAGNIYVADGAWQHQDGVRGDQNTVVKYAPNGALITRFGKRPYLSSWALGDFYWQLDGVGVSRDGARVYTTETGNNRVQYWDRQADGSYRATGYLGSDAQTDSDRSGDGHCNLNGWTSGFAAPYDLGVDGADNLFVLNTTCNELDMFSPTRTFVRAWQLAQAPLAHGVAVAKNGDVFIPQVQKKLTKVGP
jgi:sugar lactone lactonase YvrE